MDRHRPFALATVVLAVITLAALGMGVLAFWADDLLPPSSAEARGRATQLEERREVALRNIETRARIVEDVIDGKLSLLDGAARFRDLTKAVPEVLAGLRRNYPDCSDDERHCRHVISCVETRLPPERRQAEVVARLRQELALHLERGTLRLPE